MHAQGRIARFRGDGLSLAATAWGDPYAPPVLFFHGGGQNRRAWASVARHVARHGYLGITFDHRGHGESDWAEDGDYFVDAYARDVERLLADFDRPVTLVGASRGAQAALIAASRHQNRVNLVVMGDVAPSIPEGAVSPILDFLSASLAGFDSLEEAADVLSAYLGTPRRDDLSGLARALRQRDGRWYWHWDPLTAAPRFMTPPEEAALMRACAARLRRPIILVRAEHGSLVTTEAEQEFRTLTPHLVVEEAKGTHHMFTGDSNDGFARRLVVHLATYAHHNIEFSSDIS